MAVSKPSDQCCGAAVFMPTSYGGRRTCRVHRRVWTRLIGEHAWVEEKYTGFGVDGK